MPQKIVPQALHDLLRKNAPFALLDVREQHEYNAAHIASSASLPRRLIEFRALWLVPYLGTRVVLCDDDCQRAPLAAATLERMGYADVHVLDGGLNRWTTLGLPTEWGVNVPSKDFGEREFELEHVPEVTPEELRDWMRQGKSFVLLDARTPEEHMAATIPGSRSLPGGELALRIPGLLDGDSATVVVHCAGRTRSIIGARTLQRMGVSDVYCLRNGTMGWALAGLELERGSSRVELPAASPETASELEAKTIKLAEEDGVQWISPAFLRELMSRAAAENVYLVDIRTREEYAFGHIPDFQWYAGGQAVQAADDLVGVRQGHLVFACDGVVRAGITASWFRRMGYPHVYALQGGTPAWIAAGGNLQQGPPPQLPWGYEAARETAQHTNAEHLQHALRSTEAPAVIFVDTSRRFSEGHPAGAVWISRSWLELHIGAVVQDKGQTVVTVCTDGVASMLAAATLRYLGYRNAAALDGGMAAWRAAGLPEERGLTNVACPPNDVLAAGTERSWAEMMQYLRWEEALGAKYRESMGDGD